MRRTEIRRGITRTVLLIGPWAVKIPALNGRSSPTLLDIKGALWGISRGIQANLSEREWSQCEGVCPVRWTLFGLVNVYPRADLVTHELTEDEYEAIGFIGSTDRKPQNVGLLNGKLVWIDYDMSWNDCPPCCRATGKPGGR